MNNDIKRKICFICYLKNIDPVIEQFSKSISKCGYNVTILSLLDTGQKKIEILNNRNIYRIDLPYKLNNRIRKFIFFLKSITLIRKNNFSIIHIHFKCPYFLMIKIFS